MFRTLKLLLIDFKLSVDIFKVGNDPGSRG